VTIDLVWTDTQRQRDAYEKTQALIAHSPFRGVPLDTVPPGPDGKAYLDAVKVVPPLRLEHQQLEAGAMKALATYRTALEIEALAANIEHQFDVQINGKNAAPARVVLAPAAPDSVASPVLPTLANVGATGQDEVLSRYFRSKISDADVIGTPSSQFRATGGPSDVARQIETERRLELAAQQTKKRAQQAAVFRQQQAAQAQLAQ
jgi:hypothetical protein